ncbi:MAG: HD domain-containing protein [Clostridia bacterium]|nr:HD domain-containing protein [Clostridia bacterium]
MNQTMISWGEAELDALRSSVMAEMSPFRFTHTAAVEDMTARLCALYCPEKTMLLRAAALLHDLTKEKKAPEQEALCEQLGIALTPTDRMSPKTHHAKTAAALIPVRYPGFADDELVAAVRYHTTGRAGMTLSEKLIYLADYIDESRTFPDCVTLRTCFWGADPESMSMQERLSLLDDVIILSFDMTIRALLSEGAPISPDTVSARSSLLCDRAKRK